MFLVHGPLGLIVAHATKKIWDKDDFTSNDRALLYSSSLVTGILPDIDLLYALFDPQIDSHHTYITHTMLPYLIIFIIVSFISFFLKGKLRKIVRSLNLIFILNIFFHLISDSIVSDIKLFYPLSNKTFSFLNESPIIQTDNPILSYFYTPALLIFESSIFIFSLYILFKLKKDKKVFLCTFSTFAFISIIALLMVVLFLILLTKS